VAQAGRYQITPKGKIRYIRYLEDFEFKPVTNAWFDVAGAVQDRADPKIYVVQTSNKIIERCLLMTTDPGDLVLDPTCGSVTTAFVAEKWGRRWITCDTSRVAMTLARQRLMTASYDYFPLRYPHEGLKGGFEYETVSHVTQESIAKNSDIDGLYADLHPPVESALSDLNNALTSKTLPTILITSAIRKGQKIVLDRGTALLEWEVPYEWPEDWPASARLSFDAFHLARRTMQRAISSSISDHAETRTLYNQPAKDNKRQRITGPFSVEAVPSPIVIGLHEAVNTTDPDTSIARSGETSRQATWRDELMKTGIRGKAGQVLGFADLETIPGMRHLHASGTFSETGERAVVSFGPEHAPFEQRRVEMALLEAEKLRPAPVFVIFCSFAFDPEAAKDIDEVQWPGVTLLKAQMNPDLLTEDLKKARASNQSFWLMGQPDLDARKRQDGMAEVEVNGFDYFDTKKGELTSGGNAKIAMWSLDTDYDQRSLYPNQVFFPMAGTKNGWNRLRQDIKAEIDEALPQQFHGTVSLPFAAGDHRRVAVKIVDNRGIEALKIVALDD
jgi:adenine-specific DNA-methyltransferase